LSETGEAGSQGDQNQSDEPHVCRFHFVSIPPAKDFQKNLRLKIPHNYKQLAFQGEQYVNPIDK
jgi:hypothetical protein